MVPWGYDEAKATSTAAAELKKALERQGGSVTVSAASGGATVVTARFDVFPLGAVYDEAEFVLSGSSAAFRAASSWGGVWPFASRDGPIQRNRQRLLKVRKRLFEANGWRCACPPDLNPFAAAKCALSCDA